MQELLFLCGLVGACAFLGLLLGNAATGEPLLHKPGHTPGSGIAGWWDWMEPWGGK